LSLGLWLSSYPALAQDAPADTGVSTKLIEARLAEVEANQALEADTRKSLVGLYRKALGFAEAVRSESAAANAFAQAREGAADEALQLRQQVAEAEAASKDVVLDLPQDASARDVERRLNQERASRAAATTKLSGIEQKLTVEANRPGVVRQNLVKAKELSEKLSGDLKAQPPADEAPLFTEAGRWVLTTRIAALAAEIRRLDQELLSRPMRLDLLRAEQTAISRSLKRMNLRLTQLDDLLAERRRRETEQVIAEADDAAVGEGTHHPVLDRLVAQNRKLGEELTALNDDLVETEAEGARAIEERTRIQTQFQNAKRRVAVAGLSQALGQILHEQRRDLPDLRRYQRRQREREEIIAAVGLRDIQLEAEMRESQDLTAFVESRLAGLSAEEREELAEPARALVDSRQNLLKRTAAANTKHLRALGNLEFEEGRMLAIASEFDAYLAERLLWVRTKAGIGLGSLAALPAELLSLYDPRRFLQGFEVLGSRFTQSPLLALALALALPILFFSRALRTALRDTGKKVGKPAVDSFVVTLQAVGYTFLLSVPWPILSAAAGWELSHSLEGSEDVKALGLALLWLPQALFFVRGFRVMCVDDGLAEAHFKWSDSSVGALRIQLDQLLFTFLLPAYVAIDSFNHNSGDYGGETTRFAFLLAALGLARFLVRMLRPKSGTGILHDVQQDESVKPMPWIWLVLAAAVPLALASAALAGYLYSATTLMGRLLSTLWLAFGILVAHELVGRWLLLVKQRVWLRAVLERREADRLAREQEDKDHASEDMPVPLEEPELDIAAIDSDTRTLVNTGLAVVGFLLLSAIWSSVLPALAILRDFALWETLEGASGEQHLVPITLANLGMALLYAFMTYISARNLPSLLEIVLRQHGTDPGTRLAYATLTRYFIVLLGVSLTAGSVGFNWSNIQWLVAALGVGIGFGLQDIVANFISGLIILMERPIRVGDIVTVGDVSGMVTRIQLRATTVTNWDRQELLVPNREFITTRVLNWSLSDEVIRLVMHVGVEYGTDLHRALALVREAVESDERVLEEPKPLVTFDEFGDNSLHITARAFIGSLANRRETISDLNLAINDKLKEAGIVVAFPQRDVHLDASSPLDIRIRRESDGESDEEESGPGLRQR